MCCGELVDEHGAELDILLQKRRHTSAAERFLRRVLRSCPMPCKIVTDQLRSYPAAKSRIPELANVKHVFVKAAARVNNRAEIAINLRVNVRGAFAGFATQSAPRRFSRISDGYGNTSRSSGMCARHCIANSLQQGSLPGVNLPDKPQVRRLASERNSHLPAFGLTLGKLTTPSEHRVRLGMGA
jgi:putative transposase